MNTKKQVIFPKYNLLLEKMGENKMQLINKLFNVSILLRRFYFVKNQASSRKQVLFDQTDV